MKKTILLILPVFLFSACSKTEALTADSFTTSMNDYLAQRGDFCLHYEWPVDVTRKESEAGSSREALQMPALEKVGLVSAADAVGEIRKEDGAQKVAVRRYQLSDEGRKYLRQHTVPGNSGHPAPVKRSDLCAAHLSLDKIVSWTATDGQKSPQAVQVSYTYRVKAEPWASNTNVQGVYPLMTHVLQGAGHLEMTENLVRTANGWVARELLN